MRRRVPAALAAAGCAAALGACGGPSADLFVVHRTGSLPGAQLEMLLGDGGTVSCNGGPDQEISSKQLIEARDITFHLNGEESDPGPARSSLTLPPGPGSILRYRVRSEFGVVGFSDTSRRQPLVFYRIAKLTRDLAQQVCGLPR